jgi:2-dehydro-3-deoxyphosphooctonate aldolase (KDO 8-P synthase)
MPSRIPIGDVVLDNDAPFVLLGGLNVLESRDLALRTAEHFREVTARLGIPYVFKASFDKANRSSIRSFRGPGLDEGLEILRAVRDGFDVPVITDVHTPAQAAPVAEVAAILQIPAFLCRQTDLLAAAAATGRPLHIKKMQMMAPDDMRNVVSKCSELGAAGVAVCERGTSFGYGNLVVDTLAFGRLKELGVPVTFDVTHALQLPGRLGSATGGRGAQVEELAAAGLSQGLAGLFLEAHPEPSEALCDGPCALRLDRLEEVLGRLVEVDALAKRHARERAR